MDELLLGLDIGTSRTKVGAYRRDGELVGLSICPTPLRTRDGLTDFPVLAMLDAVADLLAGLGSATSSVAGIGIATMGEVGTVLSRSGLEDLSFPAWYDDRGADVVRDLEDTYGAAWLAGSTGGHVRPTSSMAKLSWLAARGRLPDGVFLGLAGAVAWQLTGDLAQEASLAATSGAFDPVAGTYVEAIWDRAGLTGTAPAPVLAPASGRPTSTPLARRLGLRPGTMVVLAGHDHPVAAVGTGAREGEVVDSMGTGEPVLATLGRGAERPTRDGVARLVAAGLTVETWPSTGDPLLIWEGLRPGLAMEQFLASTGGARADLDAAAPAPGAAGLAGLAVLRALEQGLDHDLAAGAESWAQLLDQYAVLAAGGERLVRSATGATGVTLLTGGGLRSSRWLAAKAALGATTPLVSPETETVTRGSAAIAGMACGWWSEAAEMPGAVRLTTDKVMLPHAPARSQNGHAGNRA